MNSANSNQANNPKMVDGIVIGSQEVKPTIKRVIVPSQSSPTDTSNWDNRSFTTPNRRLVIETDQTNNGIVIAE